MGELCDVVMSVVAGVKEAGVAFEEIGAELGGGEGDFEETFIDVVVVKGLEIKDGNTVTARAALMGFS
jgi:hypothetical protein